MDVEIYNSQKQDDPRLKSLTDLVGMISGSVVLGILSYIFISGPSFYEGDACISLLAWSKLYFYICASNFIVGSLLYLVIKLDNNSNQNSENEICLRSFKSFYEGAIALALLVVFVGLCYAYDLNEPCGSLRIFILVIIIISSISMGLILCCLGCACCISMIALIKMNHDLGSNISAPSTELYSRL